MKMKVLPLGFHLSRRLEYEYIWRMTSHSNVLFNETDLLRRDLENTFKIIGEQQHQIVRLTSENDLLKATVDRQSQEIERLNAALSLGRLGGSSSSFAVPQPPALQPASASFAMPVEPRAVRPAGSVLQANRAVGLEFPRLVAASDLRGVRPRSLPPQIAAPSLEALLREHETPQHYFNPPGGSSVCPS
jgi:hypothetical protein